MAEKESTESLVPFSRITNLAHKIEKVKGCYVSVQVEYRIFKGEGRTCYKMWREDAGWTIDFGKVQELITHMKNVLNSTPDKGVAV